jgi:crossover junction endodeoxyribonuclease RuvC
MKVLGVDPGTHRVGWGIIEGTAAKQKIVACGCVESKPGTPSTIYLPLIEKSLVDICKTYNPEIVGIETLLFQKNVSTAITVAQARGIILLTAGKNNLKITELAPNSIKSAVAGNGAARKEDVERMVGLLLGIDTRKLLDDTTDALAIAIATLVTHRI